jgi:hypothetical protein
MGTFEARKSYPLTGHDQNSINSPSKGSNSHDLSSKKPRKERNIYDLASAICLVNLSNYLKLTNYCDLEKSPTNCDANCYILLTKVNNG